MIVDERMRTYINSLDMGNTPFLEELEQYAIRERVPIIRREMQSFIKMFLAVNRPKRILEVGTAIGFSTDIYCICSENNSNLQHLKTASRNQQFYFSHIVHSCFTLTVTPSPKGMIEVIRDGLCFSSYRYSRILLYMVLFLRSTR